MVDCSTYYPELQAVCDTHDVAAAYTSLNSLFQRFLLEATEQAHTTLVGPFARVDYLLKTHKASRSVAQHVNAARVHIRQVQDELALGSKGNVPTRSDLLRDVATVRLFIELVDGKITAHDEEHPPQPSTASGKSHTADYYRIIVSGSTDGCIRGILPTGEEVCVHPSPSYIEEMCLPGTQLNLIRPRWDNGVLHPELIIYEPDYLIDISALSRCITEYADSPQLYLLNKLAPEAQSEALLLGNFASQLLDEELHATSHDTPYADSAREFFSHYALDLLALPPSSKFHQNALQQQMNIRAVLRHDLPEAVPTFDAAEGMVEPSFFSEMLGLQGRMDYLQTDMRVLIEQKSGKGAFVAGDTNPDVPKIQQPHYVQLLLYMAVLRYNYRSTYEANNRELYAFLMYSRYRNALQGKGFAPELLQQVFLLRNRIVAAERRHAHEGFGELLTLTADAMNERGVTSTLWNAYQRPQIESILAPLQNASPLEQAYVLRMLRFVALEQFLGKLGNAVKEDSGFASSWLCTLQEKCEAGSIILASSLSLDDNDDSEHVSTLTLHYATTLSEGAFSPDAPVAINFRPGDTVFCYPYETGTMPDARQSMVFRANISAMYPDRVILRLRAQQTDARIFQRRQHCAWAIEHDYIESSHTALHRSVYSFLGASRGRRDLLLLRRPPHVNANRQLCGDYGKFNELQLRVKQADELFLIIGPPGTGKTSFGMLYTLQEALCEPDQRVLILSYTNRAVDEICSKLVEAEIPFIRFGSELSCAMEYRPYLWESCVAACGNSDELRRRLLSSRVIVGTTTAITSRQQLFTLLSFDLAIIDEASQILEPHLLALLSAMHGDAPAIRKIVMIGDHKQLPAVVQQRPEQSCVREPLLREIGLTDCALSLFQRLLSRYADDPSVTYMLTRQGRMHPLIAEFPNQAFYQGRLTAVGLPHQQESLPLGEDSERGFDSLVASRRVAFLPVTPHSPAASDKVNDEEAALISRIVDSIYRRESASFDALHTVGIIVPYRNQIAAIRRRLAMLHVPALLDITIDTVERFQGSQRRYIIYGFTVSRPYQLRFLTSHVFLENGTPIDRKLNVVMTRAQEHLIMVGNPDLLRRIPLFAQLIDRYHN